MRGGKWKLVIDRRKPNLFDLEKEIGEQNNLAEKYPKRVRDMMQRLEV